MNIHNCKIGNLKEGFGIPLTQEIHMRTRRERLGLRYCSHNHIGSKYEILYRTIQEGDRKFLGSLKEVFEIPPTQETRIGSYEEQDKNVLVFPLLLSCHIGSAFRKCYRSTQETLILPIYTTLHKKWERLISLSETRKELEKTQTHDNATHKKSVQ